MDEKKDSLVVKPYKDDVVSSIAIGILCILMGIIFPDDGMYMFLVFNCTCDISCVLGG